jgi:hypothetical protein
MQMWKNLQFQNEKKNMYIKFLNQNKENKHIHR